MGERSNVFFKNKNNGVGVYSHWAGMKMADAVAKTVALQSFQSRLRDPSYATRVGVQSVLEALGATLDKGTGFGIWTPEDGPDDNNYPFLVVDVNTGAVCVSDDYLDCKAADRVNPPTAEALRQRMLERTANPLKASLMPPD